MQNKIKYLGVILMLAVLVLTAILIAGELVNYTEKAEAIQDAELLTKQKVYIMSQYKNCLFCIVWLLACYVINKNIFYILVKRN